MVWWYLFCLALGREDHEDDVVAALGRLTQWLGELTGAGESAVVNAGDLLGLPGRTVVVTDAEGEDLVALVAAVRRRAPLIAVRDVATAVRVGRDNGREVHVSGDLLDHDPVPLRPWSLWLGEPVDLRAVPDNARRVWQELPESERTELFAALE